jgi:hypothetical protein
VRSSRTHTQCGCCSGCAFIRIVTGALLCSVHCRGPYLFLDEE